jgi:hypothetical protein
MKNEFMKNEFMKNEFMILLYCSLLHFHSHISFDLKVNGE